MSNTPEGWEDGSEDEGLPDEQDVEVQPKCSPADLLRMPQEDLPE